MDIIDRLKQKDEWLRFLTYKTEIGNETVQTLRELSAFIDAEGYIDIADSIADGRFSSLPEKKTVNKAHTIKKRVVYSFGQNENFVLKLIAYLLHDYDSIFSGNLYSFRKDVTAKDIIKKLTRMPNINEYYSYKIDIHNYFNSVSTELLTSILEEKLPCEKRLVSFISGLLSNPYVTVGENITQDNEKGIMAGIPVSSFLANLYLSGMDFYFEQRNIIYARYSDDIIVFAKTPEEIEEYAARLAEFLEKYRLELNTDKLYKTAPGEKWTFLGFSYDGANVDISDISIEKLKKKMKRKAKSLYRWKVKKNAEDDRAVKAYIRQFNRKLFENSSHNELTWCRWYFPLITTDRSLRELDAYMLQCIRYIVYGKYQKSCYNFRYEEIKRLGYRSLVAAYYDKDTYIKQGTTVDDNF